MDDAGGGRRGLRAQIKPELRAALERGWGIAPDAPMRDLGGSSNLIAPSKTGVGRSSRACTGRW